MRHDTKRWIEEIASAIQYLFDNEPWLTYKELKDEIMDYYDGLNTEYFKRAYKLADSWDKYR